MPVDGGHRDQLCRRRVGRAQRKRAELAVRPGAARAADPARRSAPRPRGRRDRAPPIPRRTYSPSLLSSWPNLAGRLAVDDTAARPSAASRPARPRRSPGAWTRTCASDRAGGAASTGASGAERTPPAGCPPRRPGGRVGRHGHARARSPARRTGHRDRRAVDAWRAAPAPRAAARPRSSAPPDQPVRRRRAALGRRAAHDERPVEAERRRVDAVGVGEPPLGTVGCRREAGSRGGGAPRSPSASAARRKWRAPYGSYSVISVGPWPSIRSPIRSSSASWSRGARLTSP